MQKRFAAIATVLLVYTGACSNDKATSAPAIDTAKLDAGNYATTPFDVETLRNASSGSIREAIRIGAVTPIPFEYDSRFAYGPDYNRSQIITPDEPPYPDEVGIKLERKNFSNEFPGLVAGWRTHGTRRLEMNMGRIIDTYTVRFDTPESARNAAIKMSTLAPGTAYSLAKYGDAYTKVTQAEPSVTAKMHSWLVQDDMVLYLQIRDPVSRPFDPLDNAEIIEKFYDAQIERLSGYIRTPINEISRLPLDVDGMLSRTLPAEKFTSRNGVIPTHVAVAQAQKPVVVSAAYKDAGVDYIVWSGAFVYRAKDSAGAERLAAAFGSDALSSGAPMKVADAPPNMPSALCNVGDTDRSIPPSCRFTVGRYLVRVGGANLQDVYQRAAAQYLLLTE
ncbi:hypothetical protein [Nocardia sp. NPDC050413]|uniref:DUF7373 family lipoprotein n=1 Tax=Nocardia sp. NPDC050413 TaxID=3155784 RepID=UPI0033D88965